MIANSARLAHHKRISRKLFDLRLINRHFAGGVAQVVEQGSHKPRVPCSSHGAANLFERPLKKAVLPCPALAAILSVSFGTPAVAFSRWPRLYDLFEGTRQVV